MKTSTLFISLVFMFSNIRAQCFFPTMDFLLNHEEVNVSVSGNSEVNYVSDKYIKNYSKKDFIFPILNTLDSLEGVNVICRSFVSNRIDSERFKYVRIECSRMKGDFSIIQNLKQVVYLNLYISKTKILDKLPVNLDSLKYLSLPKIDVNLFYSKILNYKDLEAISIDYSSEFEVKEDIVKLNKLRFIAAPVNLDLKMSIILSKLEKLTCLYVKSIKDLECISNIPQLKELRVYTKYSNEIKDALKIKYPSIKISYWE